MPRPPKRAALLLRVSTYEQSNRYGLEAQETAARHYAKTNGLEVTAVFADVVSGASESRPKFYELLARAAEFDAVVVAHVDRLARENELGFRHMRLIREAGLELHSAARGLVDDSITTGLEVVIAAEEKKRISQRTYAGLLAKARAGLVPTNIQLYGYRDIPGTGRVVPEPREAEMIQFIFRLAAEGKSYHEIACELNALPDRRLRRKAKCWYPGHLTRIIRQSAYKGEYMWPEASKKGTTPMLIPVPPIVEPDLWARAQRRKVGRPPRTDRPLVGHLRCGLCGCSISSTSNPKNGYIYRCNSKTRYSGNPCKLPVKHGRTLEKIVEAAVREALSDPATLQDILGSVPAPDDPNAAKRAVLLEKDARWLEAFSEKVISAAELGQYRAEIKAELRALATPSEDRTFPLGKYAKAARKLPLKELLEYAKVTVIVTQEGLEVTLGT